MHRSSRVAGRAGCAVLAVVLALPGSGCSKSSPAAPAAPPPPTLTGISPDSGLRGATVPVTLTGTNFTLGAGSTQVASTAGILVTGITVRNNSSITANLVISDVVPLGTADVAVITAGGTSVPAPFTVLQPPPTLATVTPNFGGQGATVAVTLTGTKFLVGATTVDVDGTGVTTSNVVVNSAGSLSANIVIAADATLGVHGVTVTTVGGTSPSLPFTVNTPPRVTGATPNSRRPVER